MNLGEVQPCLAVWWSGATLAVIDASGTHENPEVMEYEKRIMELAGGISVPVMRSQAERVHPYKFIR